MQKPYIVGITGGSGSGKTFLLNQLLNRFEKSEISLISQDHYYKPIHIQKQDENGVENFDVPDSIEMEEYYADIMALHEGRSVEKKEYTFNNTNKKADVLIFHPAPILVLEGIFIFHHPALFKSIDLKIFIDVAEHIRLKRRITRDNQERGYDLADVLYRYEKHVYPAYQKYISPFKKKADLIIPNNDHCEVAVEVLSTFLKSQIQNRR